MYVYIYIHKYIHMYKSKRFSPDEQHLHHEIPASSGSRCPRPKWTAGDRSFHASIHPTPRRGPFTRDVKEKPRRRFQGIKKNHGVQKNGDVG